MRVGFRPETRTFTSFDAPADKHAAQFRVRRYVLSLSQNHAAPFLCALHAAYASLARSINLSSTPSTVPVRNTRVALKIGNVLGGE